MRRMPILPKLKPLSEIPPEEICDTHCPNARTCMPDCPFYKYKQARENKPLDYETNSKSPRRDLNITDQKGGADMSESN